MISTALNDARNIEQIFSKSSIKEFANLINGDNKKAQEAAIKQSKDIFNDALTFMRRAEKFENYFNKLTENEKTKELKDLKEKYTNIRNNIVYIAKESKSFEDVASKDSKLEGKLSLPKINKELKKYNNDFEKRANSNLSIFAKIMKFLSALNPISGIKIKLFHVKEKIKGATEQTTKKIKGAVQTIRAEIPGIVALISKAWAKIIEKTKELSTENSEIKKLKNKLAEAKKNLIELNKCKKALEEFKSSEHPNATAQNINQHHTNIEQGKIKPGKWEIIDNTGDKYVLELERKEILPSNNEAETKYQYSINKYIINNKNEITLKLEDIQITPLLLDKKLTDIYNNLKNLDVEWNKQIDTIKTEIKNLKKPSTEFNIEGLPKIATISAGIAPASGK